MRTRKGLESKDKQAMPKNRIWKRNGEAAERCKRNGAMTNDGAGQATSTATPEKVSVWKATSRRPHRVLAVAKMRRS